MSARCAICCNFSSVFLCGAASRCWCRRDGKRKCEVWSGRCSCTCTCTSTHKRNGRNGFCRATATAVDHGPCVRAPSLFAARQDPTLSLLSQASLKLSLQTRRALLRSRAALTRANDDKVVVATASALSPASPLRMTRIFARPAFMSRGGGFLRSRRLLWGLAPPKAARQDPATRWCRLVVHPPPSLSKPTSAGVIGGGCGVVCVVAAGARGGWAHARTRTHACARAPAPPVPRSKPAAKPSPPPLGALTGRAPQALSSF